MQSRTHWEQVYTNKAADEVSWFQPHAKRSLELIGEARLPRDAPIIDVGGGASTLVDDLLAEGYDNLSVLDLSSTALAAARSRLGAGAAHVHWREADILDAGLAPQAYQLWHDRAVFHFLTTTEERRAYVDAVRHAVKPGGFVIIATFADDGPSQCSGLPAMRYSAEALHAEFGEPFQLLRHVRETHRTPGGNEQKFVYCLMRLSG